MPEILIQYNAPDMHTHIYNTHQSDIQEDALTL